MILHCGSTHQVFDGLVFPLFSCQCWCGREREATVMAPSPMRDSAISPCFCGCLAFLLPYIPSVSPQSTAVLALGLLQLSAVAPSRGPAPCPGYVWLQQGFSFHLGCHSSAVSLSASDVSPLTQTIALMWGSDPCFSSPTCRGQAQSY